MGEGKHTSAAGTENCGEGQRQRKRCYQHGGVRWTGRRPQRHADADAGHYHRAGSFWWAGCGILMHDIMKGLKKQGCQLSLESKSGTFTLYLVQASESLQI